jgi:hypothetical protein
MVKRRGSCAILWAHLDVSEMTHMDDAAPSGPSFFSELASSSRPVLEPRSAAKNHDSTSQPRPFAHLTSLHVRRHGDAHGRFCMSEPVRGFQK